MLNHYNIVEFIVYARLHRMTVYACMKHNNNHYGIYSMQLQYSKKGKGSD